MLQQRWFKLMLWMLGAIALFFLALKFFGGAVSNLVAGILVAITGLFVRNSSKKE
ncbi:MAG: hypothetical protein JNJ57_08775 [Saprospiraceae bacterium]|nr:hypothetical protein [Saprospiraceae bacterium]